MIADAISGLFAADEAAAAPAQDGGFDEERHFGGDEEPEPADEAIGGDFDFDAF